VNEDVNKIVKKRCWRAVVARKRPRQVLGRPVPNNWEMLVGIASTISNAQEAE
jgi:hypothetical protein